MVIIRRFVGLDLKKERLGMSPFRLSLGFGEWPLAKQPANRNRPNKAAVKRTRVPRPVRCQRPRPVQQPPNVPAQQWVPTVDGRR